jgi:hypothetical protein
MPRFVGWDSGNTSFKLMELSTFAVYWDKLTDDQLLGNLSMKELEVSMSHIGIDILRQGWTFISLFILLNRQFLKIILPCDTLKCNKHLLMHLQLIRMPDNQDQNLKNDI